MHFLHACHPPSRTYGGKGGRFHRRARQAVRRAPLAQSGRRSASSPRHREFTEFYAATVELFLAKTADVGRQSWAKHELPFCVRHGQMRRRSGRSGSGRSIPFAKLSANAPLYAQLSPRAHVSRMMPRRRSGACPSPERLVRRPESSASVTRRRAKYLPGPDPLSRLYGDLRDEGFRIWRTATASLT
jgi:hypothetical protein